jgi:hypothetical protein
VVTLIVQPVVPKVTVNQAPRPSIAVSAAGPQGIQGPPGPAGASDLNLYTQASPAATWIITHNLGRVTMAEVHVGGEAVIADKIDTSVNVLTIVFATPQTGFVTYI